MAADFVRAAEAETDLEKRVARKRNAAARIYGERCQLVAAHCVPSALAGGLRCEIKLSGVAGFRTVQSGFRSNRHTDSALAGQSGLSS